MPETSAVTPGIAFLIPLGYALIAVSGLPGDRSRRAAVSFFAALGLAVIGYVITGFAFQFGGIGLVHNRAGFDGLIWEWSALGPTWGPGWGMVGMAGWALSGPAATSDATALALANLPWVLLAALIPVNALRERVPAWATGLVGLLMGSLIYPVAGNWVWGGGWLANLGNNLGFGHGLADAGGSGLVHLLGAAAMVAGVSVFLPRLPRPVAAAAPTPLPAVRLPLLALLGAAMLLIGNLAWTAANPLLDRQTLDLARVALNSLLAAAAGALLALGYTWLVAGQPDPLMAARGLAAGVAASAAAAPFMPAWAALLVGGLAGLLTPPAIFCVDKVLRWDDPTAALTVHGMGGAFGLLAVGLFADGTAGAGWNGIGVTGYLGVAGQGVTGLLAAGFQPDWPGQMQAQIVSIAALALFGFFTAWLFLMPPATVSHLLRPRFLAGPAAITASAGAAGAEPPPTGSEA